tara:strand:- start:544 stop:726 length:183 start_codon:yes stop_codon:yes gene_type:complete
MNLKERGFTIGDLTILLVVILLSFIVVNKFKESKTQKQIMSFYYLEIPKNFNELKYKSSN